MRASLVAVALVAACCPPAKKPATPTAAAGSGSAVAAPAPVDVALDALTEGQHVHGFTTEALYLDDTDRPIGARFIHDATGFVFDYLRIESAPQGFLWVTSFPTSDKGEPHTQEHLLLGKGDHGRKLGSAEAMALAESSAFTAQWRTAYHFHTVAGQDEFWPVFSVTLDALLHPDYTDEEIRREVRNFGVDQADNGTLRLEEKGTVYNEMVRTYEAPETVLFRAAGRLVYGPKHPLALDSGGFPEAIRTMTPADIRAFHDASYHLVNMGMVGAFPAAMKLGDVLDKTAVILQAAEGGQRLGKKLTEASEPAPAPAPAGTIEVVDYPYSDTANPGPVMFQWPAKLKLDLAERTLLALFMDALAGDESTPLYGKLIAGKTRVIDTGATGLWSGVASDVGNSVSLGLNGVKADKLDAKTLGEVRTLITGEIDRISNLPAGDPELVAFDAKVQSRVLALRRQLDAFLDTPPGFGFRGTSSAWMDHLEDLGRAGGFRRSLTLRPQLAKVEAALAAPGNPWRDRVHAWGLTDAPYGVAAKPSPALRKQIDADRDARIAAELARLSQQYATKDAPATLARYRTDYDAETRRLEAASKAVELPPLVATPPMTLDSGLASTSDQVRGVARFAATFDSMTSAHVKLVFDVRGMVAADDQFLLPALPGLLSDAGAIVDGKPLTAGEVKDRLRREVLALDVHYSTNPHSGRVELVVDGAGNGAAETRAALGWMKRVMFAPDWRIENLPRLRDLVDQELIAVRQRMLGAEENWVNDPRDAWRQQNALAAHTSSFLTQAHDLHRLRWRLLDPGDAKATAEVVKFLAALEGAKPLPRADLVALAATLAGDAAPPQPRAAIKPLAGARFVAAAAKLSAKAKPLAREAGKDLAALLGDLPDDSLAADWAYLCKQMAKDLATGAPATLARLEVVRHDLIEGGKARIVEVGSKANQDAIAGELDALIGALPVPQRAQRYTDDTAAVFRARLAARVPAATNALYVGLVAPATSSGVFENLVAAPGYTDSGDDAILDYLTSNLYTGHGAHSMYMKTWAAGLAYSNGLHPQPAHAALEYYAERCPLLPQTLRFVIGELQKAQGQPDAAIARYAVAIAFTSRLANDFVARASAQAADLADGISPDSVHQFRTKVLELAKRPDLAPTLFGRMKTVYGKLLPGWAAPDPNGIYYVIGPDKQLAAYQDYLHAAVGKDATLYRIYPRDYWLPAKL